MPADPDPAAVTNRGGSPDPDLTERPRSLVRRLLKGLGMTTPNTLHPTLPHFGGVDERRALLAGITFLEVTSTGELDLAGLAAWFDEHVVDTGAMPRLSVVLEPPAGTVSLRPGTGAAARASADLPRILTTSRLRVVDALRGLIAAPSDDRFLRASIFLGRVRREEGHWVARPEPTAPLSGIVLSLFAVAILSERAFYDRHLCVCDTCGRVSFDPASGMRRACSTHPPRTSGINARTALRPSSAQKLSPVPDATRKTGTTPR